MLKAYEKVTKGVGKSCLDELDDDGEPKDLAEAQEQHRKRAGRKTLEPQEEKMIEHNFYEVQRRKEEERHALEQQLKIRVDQLVNTVEVEVAERVA